MRHKKRGKDGQFMYGDDVKISIRADKLNVISECLKIHGPMSACRLAEKLGISKAQVVFRCHTLKTQDLLRKENKRWCLIADKTTEDPYPFRPWWKTPEIGLFW